jgi:predicted DNA-binding transcriptional regulator YafY
MILLARVLADFGETGKKMYYSTSRVLAVLDLLQTHGRMRGEDLAARLEVDARTVRRYALILRERGIPVEMKRGRHGGYSLPAGYRQPLALTKEEALALTYGLLGGGQQALGLDERDAARMLRKVTRVLPAATRDLIGALDGAVTFSTPHASNATGEAPACLDTIVQAIQAHQRTHIVYRAQSGERTERDVDPYQVVYRAGRWYLVGHCHLRADLRVFRLEYVQYARALAETFTPQVVDAVAAVERAIAQAPWRWEFSLLADAPVETLRSRMPATVATLDPQEDGTVLLRGYADDLDTLACTLAGLRCPLVILRPDELRDAFRALADRLYAIANQPTSR